MEEIWKEIDDRYLVSNLGRVKSLYANKERILKPYMSNNGYLMVDLRHGETRKGKGVHRLVAEAFLSNENNYPEVNHKDENKTNNVVNNLEWCTTKYNCNYGTRNERKAKNCQKKVYSIDEYGNVEYFDSVIEAGIANDIDKTSISKALSNKFPHNIRANKKYWFYA